MVPLFAVRRWRRRWLALSLLAAAALVSMAAAGRRAAAQSRRLTAAVFTPEILLPPPEAPFHLRFFTTAVKTNSRGEIITGQSSDPVKRLVGAEAAGERAGMPRYTKIMFGADYFDGRPNPGDRIDPNDPQVSSGSQHWPFVPQPFRSWPNALALTADGRKLYVALPGREGYACCAGSICGRRARRVGRARPESRFPP
jgi:hypothetical protein